MDNLAILENEVAKGFAQKEHTIAAYLDIQKAFDVTWRRKIITTLQKFGINGLRKTTSPILTYNGIRLKFVSGTKFLGLQWDSKMTWSLHIEYIKKRALNSLNALKMICNKKWGVRREVLLKFYKSFILPIFDYGSFIYGSAKNHLLSKLNTIHHSGIRIATGALRSSPVVSLYVDSGIPPLSLRRTKLLMNYVAKVGASPFNPVQKVLFDQDLTPYNFTTNKPKPLLSRFLSLPNFPNLISSSDIAPYVRTVPPWSSSSPPVDLSLGKDRKKDTPPVVFQQLFAGVINSKYVNHTICYTDGSKTMNSTSCAYSINDVISSSQLNPVNSIFSAELIAIYLCLEAITVHPSDHFLIVSDSRSALAALSNVFGFPALSITSGVNVIEFEDIAYSSQNTYIR
ncbi:uncharacterized protein LOC113469414 [Diaphorina citri]|uniref:Uncharacterized protein LOC113469414 n=1 Tax=Diaphorina citri TaxID=121845 RepID=A0A3Q0J315_DIACI|nr:uncharacterized protein LOC113469414 [Diaphorina citri]